MPTVLDYKSMALYKNKDFSNVPLHNITGRIKSIISESNSPQQCAIGFYTLNHLVAVLEQNHANDVDLKKYSKVYELYNNELLDTGLKIFYYLLCICVREARHLSSIKDKYTTSNAHDLWLELKGNSGSSSVNKFITHTSTKESNWGMVSVGDLLNLLLPVFNDHSWSSSFGGKAWGNITEQLRKYVYGECSLEVLVDTAFTLSHNTGNIFNKGIIFSYDTDKLIEILDVQRSGQMPQYIAENLKDNNKNFSTLHEVVVSIKELEEFECEVDWQRVMDLGSVNQYNHKVKDKVKPVAQIPKAPKTKVKDDESEMVTIFAGFSLQKAPRKKQPVGFMGKPHYEDMEDIPL